MDVLAKLIEHNNWANRELIRACSDVDDAAIRERLTHLVESQRGYVNLLTLPPEERTDVSLAFSELEKSADRSGAALLAMSLPDASLETTDGYVVEPWVVMLQAINHGNDHRREIALRMRTLGLTPPQLDGWGFGEAVGALASA